MAVAGLSACGGSGLGEGTVYCGTLRYAGEVWLQGGMVPDSWSRNSCMTLYQTEEGVELHEDLPESNGRCHLIGEATVDGDCFTDPEQVTQNWIHTDDGLDLTWTDEDSGGSLTLNGAVWTTAVSETSMLYGLGTLTMDGFIAAGESPDDVTRTTPPSCDLPTCQEGTLTMVSLSGPADCQEVLDRHEGRQRQITVVSDTEVDLGEGPFRSAPDLRTCARHYAQDGNPFNIWTYRLEDGLETALQVERWSRADGTAVTCEVQWETVLSPCG